MLDEQSSFYNDVFSGIKCVCAGNGSGKSWVAAASVAKFLEYTEPPEKDTPFWVLSTKLEAVCRYTWGQSLKPFIPSERIQKITWHRYNMPSQVILKPAANGNNFALIFKSYDQGRDSLQNANIAGFWCDEQCPSEILNEVLARTRKWSFPNSKIYTLTPLEPDFELEERFNNPDKYPNWRFYRYNTRLNTSLNSEFIKLIEENEHPNLVETRLTGAFASFEGLIFPQFSQEHIVEPYEIPKNYYRIRGLDLGFKHATACLWCAVSPDKSQYIIYREYSKTEDSIEEHVKAIQGQSYGLNGEKWDEYQYKGATWADPANAQVLHEFSIRGLATQPAKKDMEATFATIRTLLSQKKLKIFSNCTILIQQLRSYVYDVKTQKPVKETEKRLFDEVDCLRYLCFNYQLNSKPLSITKCPEPAWKEFMKHI